MNTPDTGPFEMVSYRLGALPLINHFLGRAGLPALLQRWLPPVDRRYRLAPATAITLVVVNLLVGRAPLYGLGEWAAPFAPTRHTISWHTRPDVIAYDATTDGCFP